MLLVSTFFQTAKYYIVGVLLVTYPIRSHCIKKIFINCLVLRILNPTICTHYGFNIYIYVCSYLYYSIMLAIVFVLVIAKYSYIHDDSL